MINNLASKPSQHNATDSQPTIVYYTVSAIFGCPPVAISTLSTDISVCVDKIASWMCWNRLQLNAVPTRLRWCVRCNACASAVAASSLSHVGLGRWCVHWTSQRCPWPGCLHIHLVAATHLKNRITVLRCLIRQLRLLPCPTKYSWWSYVDTSCHQ